MTNLHAYLRRKRIKTPSTLEGAEHIFFPIKHDGEALSGIRRRGGRVIQRLDGIYHPSKHQDRHRALNQPIFEIYRYLADFVVFQSDYSRRQVSEVFGERNADSWTIIRNGVNRDLFRPTLEEGWKGARPVRFITTGCYRNRWMLEPVIFALDELDGEVDFEFHVVGPVRESSLNPLLARKYVVSHGDLSLAEVATRLRESDIFVYSHLNPPCPNSVLEAASCGLPVVGFDSGSMAELLPFGRDLLAHVSGEVFQSPDEFRREALAERLRFALNHFDTVRKRALDHAGRYGFDACGDAYVAVLKEVTKCRLPVHVRSRARRLVNSKPMDLLLKASRRVNLDRLCRTLTIEFLRRCSQDSFLHFCRRAIDTRVEDVTPSDALRTLFSLDIVNREHEDRQSIRYDNGTHTKHRHIQYRSFFIDRVRRGERILDVGSGRGELSCDLAEAVGGCGEVVGVEIREENVAASRQRCQQKNVRFVQGDVTAGLTLGRFDVVTMSNVLEHLDSRTDVLLRLSKEHTPRAILLRVPIFERDWRIPLKAEMGIDYLLDAEHRIEYTEEQFAEEMSAAGLEITYQKVAWGEIWAEARPVIRK